MTREIKFRAWDAESKKIWFPSAIKADGSNVALVNQFGLETVDLQGDQLMQYTGLKDKNGKEIYEGDLIRDLQHPDKPVYEIAWSEVETAYYRKPPYKHDPEDYPWKGWYAENSEVIGNIYENPELLC